MPISDYLRDLRVHVGTRLLLVPAVAAVIRDEQGRVLVLRTLCGEWTLPAGQMDPGESPREALTREVREETGLTVVGMRLLDVYGGAGWRTTYANGDQVEGVVSVFACDVIGEIVCDGIEIAEAHWLPGGEVPALLAHPYPASLFVS